MRRSIVWIPVLFVGSMVYWTLALGMGGLSLVSVTANSMPCGDGMGLYGSDQPSGNEAIIDEEGSAKDYQSITVNLADPLDLASAGTAVGAVSVDLVTEHPSMRDEDRTSPGGGSGSSPERRDSGRRSATDQGPGETAF